MNWSLWLPNDSTSMFSSEIHVMKLNLIARLFHRINRTDIPVYVAPNIPCKLGEKKRSITVEGVTGLEQPAFKASGNLIIFEVPSAYCNSI